ncbi:MAG: hypothetical protein LBM99_00605, partial [Bacillales bacterium]|nr:hypothetical protein [Bacillales bacterium]
MAISVSMEKKYYSKVEVKLKSLNEGEVFYKEMKSSIRSGKNEVYQKRMRETQVFDSSWIEGIESYLLNLDKIVRNPKMVMTPIEDIVRIDRAKKINARSIQHLSSHTQFVQDIDELGRVKPMKVLSTVYEDEIAT